MYEYYDIGPSNIGVFDILGAFFTITLVLTLILSLFTLVCQMKLFAKAGVSWWKTLIPFYNTWCIIQMAGLPWWFMLLSFIPFVGTFVLLYILVDWITSYDSSILLAIGCVFLPIPCMAIVAFSNKHQYIGVG